MNRNQSVAFTRTQPPLESFPQRNNGALALLLCFGAVHTIASRRCWSSFQSDYLVHYGAEGPWRARPLRQRVASILARVGQRDYLMGKPARRGRS